MQRILTQWAYLDYNAVSPIDYTILFSEYLDKGWEIVQISTAVDRLCDKPIIVVTAIMKEAL